RSPFVQTFPSLYHPIELMNPAANPVAVCQCLIIDELLACRLEIRRIPPALRIIINTHQFIGRLGRRMPENSHPPQGFKVRLRFLAQLPSIGIPEKNCRYICVKRLKESGAQVIDDDDSRSIEAFTHWSPGIVPGNRWKRTPNP